MTQFNLPALKNLSLLQNQASDPENSAWVFASAGSGKTKILTDRVLKLLLSGVTANKILCLTFTKAGAGEMQERIDNELSNWVIINDDELKQKLYDLNITPTDTNFFKARTLFAEILDSENKISVQTIHSFCQNILNTFPLEAKVPLNFKLIEESQSKFLLQKAQMEIFKNAENDIELQKIISEIFYQTNEGNLTELIHDLLAKKDKIDDLKNIFGDLKTSMPYLKKIIGLENELASSEEIIQQFYDQIDVNEINKFCADLAISGKNNQAIQVKINKFLNIQNKQNFDLFCSAFLTQKREKRKISGSINKIAINQIYSQLCDKIIELINSYQEKLYSLDIYNNTHNLLVFVDNILNVYNQLKLNNSLLDYHDLIIKTVQLLENDEYKDWIKLKMDGNFDHILIDESQDTNIQQWQIIIALTEDFFSGLSKSTTMRSIFIVGDEKQSIYSFQGSQPDISSKIYNYFSQKLADKLKKIELNNSFRSSKEILDFVDRIFSQEKYGKAICKISNYSHHFPIRTSKGYIEIWENINQKNIDNEYLLKLKNKFKIEEINNFKIDESIENESNNDEESEDISQSQGLSNAFILAEIIAKKINHWISSKKIIASKNCAIEYSDIMILLRNRVNAFPAILAQALNRYNIPFSSTQNIKFSDNLIIEDLLSVARFACLKEDDFNLIHLLKSPFFNFNEEQIFEISMQRNQKKSNIFAELKNNKIYYSLLNIIDNSRQLTAYNFYYLLLNNQDHRQNFFNRFGFKSLEILDKFLLKIAEFNKASSLDLQLLLELIDKITPQIKLDSFVEDAVKITTIHSSKGLESPIIIIPDCNINPFSKGDNILWTSDNNTASNQEIPFPIWNNSGNNYFHKFISKIANQQQDLALEENLRLLYVALTRSKDEIYLASHGQKNVKNSWYNIFNDLLNDELKLVKINDLIEFFF